MPIVVSREVVVKIGAATSATTVLGETVAGGATVVIGGAEVIDWTVLSVLALSTARLSLGLFLCLTPSLSMSERFVK